MDLRAVLRVAIVETAARLDLRAGESASSTVSILRETTDRVDVLVLGDSPVIIGASHSQTITDDRLARLDLPERSAYRARLAAGRGFDRSGLSRAHMPSESTPLRVITRS